MAGDNRQGTRQHAHSERGPDLYETPAEATIALMRTFPLKGPIWEPAAGRGAISRVLALEHDVMATDLHWHEGADGDVNPGVDFLVDDNLSRAFARRAAMVVTNPPYKHAAAFIRAALFHYQLPAIMLLRLVFIEGVKRTTLIDKHLTDVLAFKDRLPMMHRDGWNGPKITSGAIPFAWFVFQPQMRIDPFFRVRRISWRDYST